MHGNNVDRQDNYVKMQNDFVDNVSVIKKRFRKVNKVADIVLYM